MVIEAVVEDAKRLIIAGADVEMIVLFFREKGFDKIDSIRSLRALYSMTMPEAKTLIDNSKAWSDRFYSDQDLHDKARRALLELASSMDESLPRIELVGFEETDF
jgi:ribosomal protein L7/L12